MTLGAPVVLSLYDQRSLRALFDAPPVASTPHRSAATPAATTTTAAPPTAGDSDPRCKRRNTASSPSSPPVGALPGRQAAASRRVSTPSLSRIDETCDLTVSALMASR